MNGEGNEGQGNEHAEMSAAKMKVLLHYAPGPAWQRELASLDRHGLQVDWCDETDEARFYTLLPDAHVLRGIS